MHDSSFSRRRVARLRGYVNDYYSNGCIVYAKDDVNGNVQSMYITKASLEATNFWLVYISLCRVTENYGSIPLILVRLLYNVSHLEHVR